MMREMKNKRCKCCIIIIHHVSIANYKLNFLTETKSYLIVYE